MPRRLTGSVLSNDKHRWSENVRLIPVVLLSEAWRVGGVDWQRWQPRTSLGWRTLSALPARLIHEHSYNYSWEVTQSEGLCYFCFVFFFQVFHFKLQKPLPDSQSTSSKTHASNPTLKPTEHGKQGNVCLPDSFFVGTRSEHVGIREIKFATCSVPVSNSWFCWCHQLLFWVSPSHVTPQWEPGWAVPAPRRHQLTLPPPRSRGQASTGLQEDETIGSQAITHSLVSQVLTTGAPEPETEQTGSSETTRTPGGERALRVESDAGLWSPWQWGARRRVALSTHYRGVLN